MKMEKIYLFDVDGTLTPPRRPMLARFALLYQEFCQRFPVYLVSGSDYEKILEQVPDKIIAMIDGVFGCSGATLHKKGAQIYARDHNFSQPLIEFCQNFIDASPYRERTGNHIEFRRGMINLSVVGRNATQEQRKAYQLFDTRHGERVKFIKQLNQMRLGYQANIGGQISIDIAPLGWDKSVVKGEIDRQIPGALIEFFGDRIKAGGNDKPLADALMADKASLHQVHFVASYKQTAKILSQIMLDTRSHTHKIGI